jgi:hypothetical protein
MRFIANILKRQVGKVEQIITQEKSKKQNYHTLKVLFEKETADFINGKRMLLFILLMALITVTFAFLIYWPFLKAYDKSLVKQEKEMAEAEAQAETA